MWMARYLVGRVAEDFNTIITYKPKIFHEYSGAGCHCNYSTKMMRSGAGGMDYIEDVMESLATNHALHLELYGDN